MATVADVKLCSTCGEANEFGKNSAAYDGLQNECKSCRSKRHKRTYKQSAKYREQSWAGRIRREYGWTPEQYYEVLADQDGGCAVCGARDPGRGNARFCIDHNHETGETRGLLCHSCNVSIGHARDSAERLMALAAYLTSWE